MTGTRPTLLIPVAAMGKCKQANKFQSRHYGHRIINYSWLESGRFTIQGNPTLRWRCSNNCYDVMTSMHSLNAMSNPLATACQGVPYLSGDMFVWVDCLVCNWVLVLVKMSHLLSGGPLCVWLYVLCAVGSLCWSGCCILQQQPVIFCQVAHCVCDCMSPW